MHKLDRDALRVRPNTALPARFFQKNMVVCTGEDPGELREAMRRVFNGRRPLRVHQYRCYRFWMFKGVTVAISGIGSGCLEPLMGELLNYDVLGETMPERLVMIGTAGYLADSGFGQVYVVDGAYGAGLGVTAADRYFPVRPYFEGLDSLGLPAAEEISTDYYYGCTPAETDWRKVLLKDVNPALRDAIKRYWKPGRLISMESAQFYLLSFLLGRKQPARLEPDQGQSFDDLIDILGASDVQYVALRGVANLADQFSTQGDYSLQVLTEALGYAVKLLVG